MSDLDLSRGGRRHWVLAIVCGLLVALAIGLAAAAFTVARPGAGVVLEAVPVKTNSAATYAPSPSLDEPRAPSAPGGTPLPGPVSRENEEAESLELEEPASAPPAVLTIGDLGIEYGVTPVGLQDHGAMEIPTVEDIGWYIHGATPGGSGATVLVAHVWWNGEKGPFHRLGALELGASIDVRVNDGELHTYAVVERAMYDKDKLPGHLWRTTGPETLVLITCGGTFDSATRSYEQNIVVYATPAIPAPGGAS